MATLDMAGIITRICTKLKTKFSKVSIGHIGSGTVRVAAITIDGVQYDLWAPTPPSASAALPQMDGVASAGSSAGAASGYSRGNHVHPTDTSRQAKITANGLLKGDGNGGVSAAVLGTDYALLPSVTSADNGKMLMVINGAWAAAEAAGGSTPDIVIRCTTKAFPSVISNYSIEHGSADAIVAKIQANKPISAVLYACVHDTVEEEWDYIQWHMTYIHVAEDLSYVAVNFSTWGGQQPYYRTKLISFDQNGNVISVSA